MLQVNITYRANCNYCHDTFGMVVIIFQGCTSAVNKHINMFYYLNCNAHKRVVSFSGLPRNFVGGGDFNKFS